MMTIEALILAATDYYAGMASAPSVITSRLPNGQWYASVAIYHAAFGEGKEVVASARDSTLDGAYAALLRKLAVIIESGPFILTRPRAS